MKAVGPALFLGAVLLGGCIPQVDPPYREPAYPPPPPSYPAPDDRYAPPSDRYDPPPDDRYQRPDDRDQPPYDRDTPDDRVTALAAPPPAWRAAPVTPDAQTVAPGSYVVQPGDTLRAIGERTGAGSEAIARANGLAPPFTVRAGQRLDIPGGRYHRVRAGETGIAIARAYGVDWARIVAANDLTEPYILRVGMRVLIPGSGTPSRAEQAAAFRISIDDLVTGSNPASDLPPAPPATTRTRPLAPLTPVAEPSRLRGHFAWPAYGRIVDRFGPSGATGEKFNGINIALPSGSPVAASADGVVAYAGSEVANLGGVVIVKHGDGWSTVYANASRLLVQRGQAVKRGQTIALSGATGTAARPQLHFEIRKGRTPVDPVAQLPPR